ncbi:MAG: hypothetical protein IJ412_00890 [Oscillospiraceae bacterium]|nr:hypothetical protein [Oscillospiraceae bacterium]
MSVFHEPLFQKMMRRARLHKLWGAARCIYCWAFMLLPVIFFKTASETLPRFWLWVYLIGGIVLFFWGIALWTNGWVMLRSPIHKPLIRFLKKPDETALLHVCAALMTNRAKRRYPNADYDLLRNAHTVAARMPQSISPKTLDFYTLILRNCKVAGI